ncbi:MAG: hypothetical protein JXR83_03565, partial [Deltaproteobacteria bacterium]|nr:hypothetical protein [Deltaproteobacteria bacterium]
GFTVSASDGIETVLAQTHVTVETYTGQSVSLDTRFRRSGTVANVQVDALVDDADRMWVLSHPASNVPTLRLFDTATDPFNPTELGSVTAQSANDPSAVAQGHLAFLFTDRSQQAFDFTDPAHPVELLSWTTGHFERMWRSGSRLYTLAPGYDDHLDVWDISTPAAPRLLGGSDNVAAGVDYLVPVGNLLYAANYRTLQVWDAADPNAIQLRGSTTVANTIRGLAVAGNYALLLVYSGGLRVVDVSVPTSPAEVGFYNPASNNFGAIAVSGTTVWVSMDETIDALDLTTPATPTLLGSYVHSRRPIAMAALGNILYLVSYGELAVVDFTNPASPAKLTGSTLTGIDAEHLTLEGSRLYAQTTETCNVIDVATPSTPHLLATQTLPFAFGLGIPIGSYVVVANGPLGFSVWDFGDPAAPVRAGGIDLDVLSPTMALNGAVAYMGFEGPSEVGGIQVLDLSSPDRPAIVTALALGRVRRVTLVAGDLLVVAVAGSSRGELVLLDVTTATAPVELGRVTIYNDELTRSVVRVGDYLYQAADYEYRVWDISDPAAPDGVSPSGNSDDIGYLLYAEGVLWAVQDSHGDYAVASYTTENAPALHLHDQALFDSISGVARQDPVTYVAANGVLHWIEMRAPQPPTAQDSLELGQTITCVEARADRAYVLSQSGRLNIVDISALTDLRLLGTFQTTVYGRYVTAVGNRAYVAGTLGVEVIDLTNEAQPRSELNVTVSNPAFVAGTANAVLTSTAGGDLQIIDISDLNFPLTFNASFAAANAVVAGDIAYVASGGLRVVDIGNPSAPVELGYDRQPLYGSLESNIVDLRRDGTKVVAVDNYGRFLVFETAGNIPVYLGTWTPPTQQYVNFKLVELGGNLASAFAWDGSDLFGTVRSSTGFLGLFDVERPAQPRLVRGAMMPRSGAYSAYWTSPFFANAELMLWTDGQTLFAYHPFGDQMLLELASGTPEPSATLVYGVSFPAEFVGLDSELRCAVSDGSCSIGSVDQVAHTASVSWVLPATAGDYEIGVSAGHYFSFAAAYARIRIP